MTGIYESLWRNGLVRPLDGRVLGGVCAGLARRFGIDPWPMRWLFLIVLVVLPGSPLLIYPLLWIFMPGQDWVARTHGPSAYAAAFPAAPGYGGQTTGAPYPQQPYAGQQPAAQPPYPQQPYAAQPPYAAQQAPQQAPQQPTPPAAPEPPAPPAGEDPQAPADDAR